MSGEENSKEYCRNGHEMTDENTYIYFAPTTGFKRCKTCAKAAKLRYMRRYYAGKEKNQRAN